MDVRTGCKRVIQTKVLNHAEFEHQLLKRRLLNRLAFKPTQLKQKLTEQISANLIIDSYFPYYQYGFNLFPITYQPSGTVNMSRISEFSLRYWS